MTSTRLAVCSVVFASASGWGICGGDPLNREAATSRPETAIVIDDQWVAHLLDHRLPRVDLPGVSLEDSIDFLRDITGANIFVNWKALQAVGVSAKTPVTEAMRDVKVSALLDDILSKAGAGLGYDVRDGIIIISSIGELAVEKKRLGPDLRQIQDSADPRLSRADRVTEKKLEQVIPSAQLPQVSLIDAINFIRAMTELNIRVNWEAIEKSGIDRQTLVTLRIRDAKVSTVLDFLLGPAGERKLGFCIDHGTVLISTIDDLKASGHAATTAPSPW